MRTLLILALALAACSRDDSQLGDPAVCAPKNPGTKEPSAEPPAGLPPVEQLGVYLDAFHVMKDRPNFMLEAHHYCRANSDDFMQCVIFDGNTADANLVGVEYIVSESLFEDLPPDERRLWHPHNYEILSGQLVIPGLPDAAEKAILAKKINSYGKTWHLWDTGHFGYPGGQELPLGAPMLAWSFNADGQIPPALLDERDRRMHVDTAAKRKDRADLAELAHPQQGVDDLRSAFPGSDGAPPGVSAKTP
jgi:hypothetical protein